MSQYTIKNFIEKANQVHNSKYNYSLVEYKNAHTKVEIICTEHDIFIQTPNSHLNGNGCPRCAFIKNAKSLSLTKEEFINKANQTHNFRYDYSQSVYNGYDNYIVIICQIHGSFNQTPNAHIRGQGCSRCRNEKLRNDRSHKHKFIEKAEQIHGNKYNYSKINYINNRINIEIICSQHGSFWQSPNNHIRQESNCPQCLDSKGEIKVKDFLQSNNINFKQQKSFKDCKYKKRLRFDFYLPKFNTMVEYDGVQHFKPIKWFGGEKAFSKSKQRDEIKNQYCLDNNIKLLRIPYFKFKLIDEILTKELNL